MKKPQLLVPALIASVAFALGVTVACSSVDPVAPQIGVPTDGGPEDASDASECVALENSALREKECKLADGGVRECGTLTVIDECGKPRTVDCGQCNPDASDANACNETTGKCECRDSRTDAQVLADECTRQKFVCDNTTPVDRCGKARAAGSCGTCGEGATCQNNVCQCLNARETGLAYLCGTKCVRECMEGCPAARNDCDGVQRTCVADCATGCPGKARACDFFSNPTSRALQCRDVPDGGACPASNLPPCTAPTGPAPAGCGFETKTRQSVCIVRDGGPGECSYCGEPGSDGLPCGGEADAGVRTCSAATRTCR